MSEIALDVSGLRAGFDGIEVLRSVDLTIRVGEIVGISGPNGSGKTTLFNSLTAGIRASATRERLFGSDLRGLPGWERRRRGLTLISQHGGVFPGLTIGENLTIAGVGNAIDYLVAYPAIASLASSVISDPSRLAGTLSGGEARLLSLLLATRPPVRLLVADEPDLGIHSTMLGEWLQFVTEGPSLAANSAVLITTHDRSLLAELCDHVYTLAQGQLFGPTRKEEP